MPGAEMEKKDGSERISFLCRELERCYGKQNAGRILAGMSSGRRSSFRVNRLKTDADKMEERLKELGIGYSRKDWFSDAFAIDPVGESALRETPEYVRGEIYMQNLSSMIPPLMTDYPEGTDVLDMCAAPGGKTTEIVSLSGGTVGVTACEKDRIRADRLRYNLSRQGCTGVNVINGDARKLDSMLRFDRVFLDAPCSGSGTVLTGEPETYKAFSEELVRNSAVLQLQLLKKGISLLKRGGILIYSTCSLLPSENEEIVRAAVRKGETEMIQAPEILRTLPLLESSVPEAVLICPDEEHEGFFAAAIRKL